VPDAVANALTTYPRIAELAVRYRYMQRCVAVGRGYNYATAFELALKLKELTYIVVEPYSSADFLHGPIAMIEPGFPVIILAPSGVLSADMQAFVSGLAERQAEVLCISDDPALLALTPLSVAMPDGVPEWLSPITLIIPAQLLAMQLAHVRGLDVDAPRSLHKVTHTR
jgi:glucosamine--fructose-6-phosphate aminotransferase (isomerizing)